MKYFVTFIVWLSLSLSVFGQGAANPQDPTTWAAHPASAIVDAGGYDGTNFGTVDATQFSTNGVPLALGGGGYTWDAVQVVETTEDPAANWTAFTNAYAAAVASTPNGNPLSNTNRALVKLPAGQFSCTNGDLFALDTDFIDVIGEGLCRYSGISNLTDGVFTYPSTVLMSSNTNSVVYITCSNAVLQSVLISNVDTNTGTAALRVNSVSGFEGGALKDIGLDYNGDPAVNGRYAFRMGFANSNFHANVSQLHCKHDIYGGVDAMKGDNKNITGRIIAYLCGDTDGNWQDVIAGSHFFYSRSNTINHNGTYKNIKSGSHLFYFGSYRGRFINCKINADAGVVSAFRSGQGAVLSGYFEDCSGNDDDFGSGGQCTLSGTFIRCRAGDKGFGGNNNSAVLSGLFIDCVSVDNGFGNSGSTLSGTFIRCSSTPGSAWGYNGQITGTFIDCVGGNNSWGWNEGDINGATFIRCVAGSSAFSGHVGSTIKDSTFIDCVAGGSSFGLSTTITNSRFIRCEGGAASFGDGSSGYFEGCYSSGAHSGQVSSVSMDNYNWNSNSHTFAGSDVRVEKHTRYTGLDTNPASAAGYCWVWAEDIGGTNELRVMDDAGNITTISPHNIKGVSLDPADKFPVTLHHMNDCLGLEQWIYLSKMARIVEALSGQTLIYEKPIPKVSWDDKEQAAYDMREAERAVWSAKAAEYVAWELLSEEVKEVVKEPAVPAEPPVYIKRPEPQWITDRKSNIISVIK